MTSASSHRPPDFFVIMAPAPPCLGTLRIATPANVLRIGIVATAGFKYSPLFKWERPHHEQYPSDTLLSYRTQFQNAIKSDDFIVLVQKDAYDPGKTTRRPPSPPAITAGSLRRLARRSSSALSQSSWSPIRPQRAVEESAR
jgi:hypothetical protein